MPGPGPFDIDEARGVIAELHKQLQEERNRSQALAGQAEADSRQMYARYHPYLQRCVTLYPLPPPLPDGCPHQPLVAVSRKPRRLANGAGAVKTNVLWPMLVLPVLS